MHPRTHWGRRVRFLLTFSPFFAALSLLARPAGAQTHAQREEARKLAGQGFEALKRKDYSSAEALFRSADALVHAPTLGVDHARALIGLGRLVEGHERYAQVLREGVAANAPWQWHMALVDAEAEFAAVERRLAWLTLTIKGAENAVVEIDGKAVPGAAQGVRRATNPGARVVSVSAQGFLPMRRSITLQEGQSAELELSLERDPNAVPAPIEPPEPRPVVVVAPPAAAVAPDRTLPIVLVSVGGAALIAGGITGFLALNERSKLRAACPGGVCVPATESEYADYRGRRDKYRGLGTASGVSLAVGAGAALTGFGLLLFTGKPSSSEAVARKTRETNGAYGTPAPSVEVGLGSFYFGLTQLF